jgi:hypothetical protein
MKRASRDLLDRVDDETKISVVNGLLWYECSQAVAAKPRPRPNYKVDMIF